MEQVTCIAPVNIAVIKYWGKKNEELIIPINDSLSITLDTEHLCAKTSVMISPNFQEDCIWLNGKKESINNPRLQNCLREVRKRAKLSDEQMKWKVHICSENNFPTAAGLASSAAGYACLTVALSKLYKVEGDISCVARSGSGSACRSIYGGFVKWCMGTELTGEDSIAKVVCDADHWPEMRILILVVNDNKKKVSSAEGMKRTFLTSDFLKYKADHVIPDRILEMEKAIKEKDFEKFAKLTMKDSNEMHASCLTAYPPCFYLNDISHRIMDLIHAYNNANGTTKAAYTFDAGPNATIFAMEEDIPLLYAVITHYFPFVEDLKTIYHRGIQVQSALIPQHVLDKINFKRETPGKLKYTILTQVGTGPQILTDFESHLLFSNGLPKSL